MVHARLSDMYLRGLIIHTECIDRYFAGSHGSYDAQ